MKGTCDQRKHWQVDSLCGRHCYYDQWASPVAQMVKKPPAMQETWV